MKVLVVVGSAPKALKDVLDFWAIYPDECEYMAAGVDVPHLNAPWSYLATFHIADVRVNKGWTRTDEVKIIHHEPAPDVDIVEPHTGVPEVSGSSALLGVLAAIRMGFTKIVLCGCPMKGPNPVHEGWDYSRFQGGWEKKAEVIKPFVRSMSGWTKEFLGFPTKEWLYD